MSISTTSWTHIALMRGDGWLAADLPSHFIIRSDTQFDSARAIQADVLTIDPFAQKACLQTAGGVTQDLAVETRDLWTVLKLDSSSCLPTIIASRVPGILDASVMEQSIAKDFPNEDVLVVGNCGWFDNQWCASPLGLRRSSGRWLQFIAAGGNSGLAFPCEMNHQGLALDEISSEVLEPQLFQSLSDALQMRYPQIAEKVIEISLQTKEQAALLVVIRKAIGPYDLKVYFATPPSPPWKRLVEHLNGEIVVERNRLNLMLPIDSLVSLFRDINFELLTAQINRHSQVIPQSLWATARV